MMLRTGAGSIFALSSAQAKPIDMSETLEAEVDLTLSEKDRAFVPCYAHSILARIRITHITGQDPEVGKVG